MNIQIIYASLTGCTQRVAEAIYAGIPGEQKTIHNLKNGIPEITGDIILVGYWGISGGPDRETQQFLSSIQGKAVGIFCTLGYYADSDHGRKTLKTGFDLVKDRNQVIGGYVCNGAVARSLQKEQGKDGRTPPTEQKELRWEMVKDHPTQAECALAAERFRERIALYEKCQALQIPFQSVV